MINYLVRLSNHLDLSGLSKEADYLDAIIKKLAARRRPGSRKGGGSWIENKIQEATRHKKNREELSGEVSTFTPHPDKPGFLVGPGGQEISMEEMGITPPSPKRSPISLLDRVEEEPAEEGGGVTILEEDMPAPAIPAPAEPEQSALSVEERLASIESRLGRIEGDLYD